MSTVKEKEKQIKFLRRQLQKEFEETGKLRESILKKVFLKRIKKVNHLLKITELNIEKVNHLLKITELNIYQKKYYCQIFENIFLFRLKNCNNLKKKSKKIQTKFKVKKVLKMKKVLMMKNVKIKYIFNGKVQF